MMAASGRASCLRNSALIMVASILISLVVVSFEDYLWIFWGKENRGSQETRASGPRRDDVQRGGPGMAFAMPVPQTENNEGDDNEDEDRVTAEAEIEVKDRTEDGPEETETGKDEQSPLSEPNVNSTDDGNSVEKDSVDVNKASTDESDLYEGFKSVRKTRAKSFLVVFNGHSGSSAFMTELRGHSELENEVFEPLDHGEYKDNTDLAFKRAQELMDRGIAKGKIPGFKVRPFHIHNKPGVWREFVKKYDCRIVWQYRENIMKQAIGEYRHSYLNDSSVVKGLELDQTPCEKGSDQRCRFRIDDMRFLHNQMKSSSKNDDRLAAAVRVLQSDEVLAVRYEDYLYERERTMKETFDFFGVNHQYTAPQRQKASPDSLCQMVVNFQELCDNFHPCPLWRPFLEDNVNNCRCKPGNWKKFDPTFCVRSLWLKLE